MVCVITAQQHMDGSRVVEQPMVEQGANSWQRTTTACALSCRWCVDFADGRLSTQADRVAPAQSAMSTFYIVALKRVALTSHWAEEHIKPTTSSHGTVPYPNLPQSGVLDVAAVVLFRPLAVPGLYCSREGGVVHRFCRTYLHWPSHCGGEDR